jgi:hypothetical protein
VLEQKRSVDLYDMDRAVLHGLDGVGDLDQLADQSLDQLGAKASVLDFGY